MKISYYELLTKIKDFETEEQYPKVYWYNNYRDKVLYVPCFDYVDGSFGGYHIENRNLENDDIRYWLSECMLESSMFDKTLEILEVKDKEYEDIEEITYKPRKVQNAINALIRNQKYILGVLDELQRDS